MHYYVDGYNLIFRTLVAGESLQHRRDRLIADLSDKIELIKISTILVFDSQYQKNEATRRHYKSMEIYYTDEQETADDYIIKSLKQRPKNSQVTVVTSDLHLAWRARREGALTMSAEEFLSWLQRRYRNKVQQVRESLEVTAPQKTNLPVLLPEIKKNEKIITVKVQSEIDFYMEQFGGVDNEDHNTQTPKKGKSRKSLHQEEESTPPKKYESDFDRWLREFEK